MRTRADKGQCVKLEKKAAYLQELGELEVAEVLLIVLPKVQTDELAVPFEGDVVMHCGLAEYVTRIICSTNGNNNTQGEKKKGNVDFSDDCHNTELCVT